MAMASAVPTGTHGGQIAKSIESQTAKLPSDTFLWAAITAIGAPRCDLYSAVYRRAPIRSSRTLCKTS